MKDDYKTLINSQVKDSLNEWIEDLKVKHPALLLTRQWNALYPKGFHPGNNLVSIVTGSKKGKHLVGELNIFLADTLELDLNNVELLLKNEPYNEKKELRKKPVPLDEPLDVLNDIVCGVNQFLQNIHLPETVGKNPVLQAQQINIKQNTATPANTDEVKKDLLNSAVLPEWFRTIESPTVRAELAQKLADSFVHYQQQAGRKIEFAEFFNVFTEHLKKQNKLQHYCRYKGKEVKLDSNQFCTESFCSKKPYNAICNQTTLKFGETS